MKLIYGNPSYDSVQLMKNSILLREWIGRGILKPLVGMSYPDEMLTSNELWHLVVLGRSVNGPRLDYIKKLDENLYAVMSEYLDSFGVRTSPDEIEQLFLPYEPIIDYLKVVYNRPRPFQMAGYMNIPLYPILQSSKAYSGSYPGGHVLLSLFGYHIFSRRYPHLKRDLLNFVVDVKLSREEGGVHYPSDGVFSFHVYRHIRPFMAPQ